MTRSSVIAFLAGVKLAAVAAALVALARDAHLVDQRDRAIRQAEYWERQVGDPRCSAALHEAELLAAKCDAVRGRAMFVVDGGRGDVRPDDVVGDEGGARDRVDVAGVETSPVGGE